MVEGSVDVLAEPHNILDAAFGNSRRQLASLRILEIHILEIPLPYCKTGTESEGFNQADSLVRAT
jgi:hypothetical protein